MALVIAGLGNTMDPWFICLPKYVLLIRRPFADEDTAAVEWELDYTSKPSSVIQLEALSTQQTKLSRDRHGPTLIQQRSSAK